MAYYAGINIGQSSTQAVIADDTGHILGRGSAGPGDEVGQDPSSTRLRDAAGLALADATAHAGLPPDSNFAAIYAGISGYEGRVYGQPLQLPTPSLTLDHDAPIAHAGALGGAAGVVVIAGTGSVAYARNEQGASALTGGWGYVFGDQGSAFWLARKAISNAMRGRDAGEPDDITQIALQHFNVASLRSLASTFYTGGISRAQIAAFAQVVIAQAENGNERAAQFVNDGAQALVILAMRAMDRAGMQAPNVAFTGGLLQSATMRNQIEQWFRKLIPQAHLVAPQYDEATGALLLAYRGAGITAERIA
ncbi:MAG TPA: BadF/BadG/BcrA/BcrD ATPase family protein [Candidatus Baltobacteraceae bacterium]|nr:BadF/BadG/BcrA/BcrD ATPase family protein [Candidatus Baltobacteraceae bacterium]